MKCIFFFCFVVLSINSIHCQKPESDLSIKKAEEPVRHQPKLLLALGEEAQIQKAIQQNSSLQKVHSAIIESCNEILTMPLLERELIGEKTAQCVTRSLKKNFLFVLCLPNDKGSTICKKS